MTALLGIFLKNTLLQRTLKAKKSKIYERVEICECFLEGSWMGWGITMESESFHLKPHEALRRALGSNQITKFYVTFWSNMKKQNAVINIR